MILFKLIRLARSNKARSAQRKYRKFKLITGISVIIVAGVVIGVKIANYNDLAIQVANMVSPSELVDDTEGIDDKPENYTNNTSGECKCGNCSGSTINSVVIESSIDVDYGKWMASSDDTYEKAVAQMMQFIEALGKTYKIPALLHAYSNIAMESGSLLSNPKEGRDWRGNPTGLASGQYNIFKYRMLGPYVKTPGLGGGKVSSYRVGAFGMIQVEGDTWFTESSPRAVFSSNYAGSSGYVSGGNSHMAPLVSSEELWNTLMSSIGHSDYLGEYSQNGKTNLRVSETGNEATDFPMKNPQNFKEAVFDFGYVPAQLAISITYADDAIFQKSDAYFDAYFNGFSTSSEAEKNMIKVFLAMDLWNAGGISNITDNNDLCELIQDYVKYLIQNGSSKLGILKANSNHCVNDGGMYQLLKEMYGEGTEKYNKYINQRHVAGCGNYCGVRYGFAALAKAEDYFNKALAVVGGTIKGSIYTLEGSAGASTNNGSYGTHLSDNSTSVDVASCGCSVPCPYCNCHGVYNAAEGTFDLSNTAAAFTNVPMKMSQADLSIINGSDADVWKAITNGASVDHSITTEELSTVSNGQAVSTYVADNLLTTISVPVWKFKSDTSNERESGSISLTVNKTLAGLITDAMTDIYNHPAKLVVDPKYSYCSFGYRTISGTNKLSTHAYGGAFDLCFATGNGGSKTPKLQIGNYYYGNTTIEYDGGWKIGTCANTSASNPKESISDYLLSWDTKLQELRKYQNEGNYTMYQELMCTWCQDDPVVLIMKAYGFRWGGLYSNWSDGMHFSYSESTDQVHVKQWSDEAIQTVGDIKFWNMGDGKDWGAYSWDCSTFGQQNIN